MQIFLASFAFMFLFLLSLIPKEKVKERLLFISFASISFGFFIFHVIDKLSIH